MKKIVAYLCLFTGAMLLLINLVGLGMEIRKPNLESDTTLRFTNDISLDYQQALEQIKRLPNESDREYADRVTYVISQALAHPEWKTTTDKSYNQLIPIWENYFLYFMGKFSGIPEYEKYHFANYRRSLERGVGICGDASMIMSQLLDEQGISNQLYVFPGHVIVSASFSDGSQNLFDPDFGVVLPGHVEQVRNNPQALSDAYSALGYTQLDGKILNNSYAREYSQWNGVSHFITKKYYFEIVSYWLKWLLPLALIIVGFVLFRKHQTQTLKN